MTFQSSDGRQSTADDLRQALVDRLKHAGAIESAAVESAFRAVPRHIFLPDSPIETVYRDDAIPTKRADGVAISSSSQPTIMAIMLEQLDVRPGHRVLEIGAATGYNAALLAKLTGPRGHVVSVDIDEDLAAGARAHLAAAGIGNVDVVCADGGFGWQQGAPYDRIIVTAGAWDVAPAWQQQLKSRGRLIAPLSLRTVQKSVALEPRDGYLESVSVRDCGFMRLRGAFAGPESVIPLGSTPSLLLTTDNPSGVQPATLYVLLQARGETYPTGMSVSTREVWSLLLWVALHEPAFAQLSAQGAAAEEARTPFLFGISGKQYVTAGLIDPAGLALLARPPSVAVSSESGAGASPLSVQRFGASSGLAQRLLAQVHAWNLVGRPSTEQLRLTIYPSESGIVPSGDGITIAKRWTNVIARWASRA